MTNLIIFSGVIFFALFTILKGKQQRKIAEAELQIAIQTEKMQNLLLDATLTQGDVSHDIVFKAMQAATLHQSYSLPWNLIRFRDPEYQEFDKAISKELAEQSCPFSEILDNFHKAYFRAFRYKHPLQLILFPLYVTLVYISIRGLVATLKTSFQIISHFQNMRGFYAKRYTAFVGGFELKTT